MNLHFDSRFGVVLLFATALGAACVAQEPQISKSCLANDHQLRLAGGGAALPIYVSPQEPELLRLAANAFAGDVERVTGVRPKVIASLEGVSNAIIVGIAGNSPAIAALEGSGKLDVSQFAVSGRVLSPLC